MNCIHSIQPLQIIWVVGAIERLVWLGMIEETPFDTTSDFSELYTQIDEERDSLFANDREMNLVISEIIKYTEPTVEDETINLIFTLIWDYKNRRTELVKFAFNNQFN